MHWKPQYQHCNPCVIKYDFIGRFEQLHHDTEHVMAALLTPTEPKSSIKLPSLNKNRVSESTMKHIYTNLSRNIIQKLIYMYKSDYDLFGYDYHWACSSCQHKTRIIIGLSQFSAVKRNTAANATIEVNEKHHILDSRTTTHRTIIDLQFILHG